MPGFSWHMPLDPDCPVVEHAFMIPVEGEDGEVEWIDDPYASMCGEDLWAGFEKKHRATCERCQQFGAANIEVVGP